LTGGRDTQPATDGDNFNFEDDLPFGIKVLYSPEASVVDSSLPKPTDIHVVDDFSPGIVFMHGLTDDRDKTWNAQHASEPRPKTLLPSKLPTARILTFGYDAYIAD